MSICLIHKDKDKKKIHYKKTKRGLLTIIIQI